MTTRAITVVKIISVDLAPIFMDVNVAIQMHHYRGLPLWKTTIHEKLQSLDDTCKYVVRSAL